MPVKGLRNSGDCLTEPGARQGNATQLDRCKSKPCASRNSPATHDHLTSDMICCFGIWQQMGQTSSPRNVLRPLYRRSGLLALIRSVNTPSTITLIPNSPSTYDEPCCGPVSRPGHRADRRSPLWAGHRLETFGRPNGPVRRPGHNKIAWPRQTASPAPTVAPLGPICTAGPWIESMATAFVSGRVRAPLRSTSASRLTNRSKLSTGHFTIHHSRLTIHHSRSPSYANIPFTTSPDTSVNRKSRPWNLKVSFLCSMPSRCSMVACRSCTGTTSSTAL